MGLVHQFAIIPKDSDESIVSSDMDSVSISDMIIQYIGDSLMDQYNLERQKTSKWYFILWIFIY